MPPYSFLLHTINYTGLFLIIWISRKYQSNRLLGENGRVTNRPMLMILHVGGILWMAMFCIYIFPQPMAEIIFGRKPINNIQLPVILFFAFAAVIIARMEAEKKFALVINRPHGSFSHVFIIHYFLARVFFLGFYEIGLRGYFLSNCIDVMTIPFALLMNIAVYCLLHWVNGKREILGCIPVGLILGGLCVWTGAAWPAILIPIVMTLSYELHLIKKLTKSSILVV